MPKQVISAHLGLVLTHLGPFRVKIDPGKWAILGPKIQQQCVFKPQLYHQGGNAPTGNLSLAHGSVADADSTLWSRTMRSPPHTHTSRTHSAGVPLVVVRPGRQGEKQVARLSDTAVPRAGQAALEEHRAVTSSRGGRENSARHKDFRGGSAPTSCLLAMKRHGPFSSPGHVRDHEPFFIHWDRAIPQPGYPQP